MAGKRNSLFDQDLDRSIFVTFFLGHGLSVIAVFYAVFGFGFRPTLRSVGKIMVKPCYIRLWELISTLKTRPAISTV